MAHLKRYEGSNPSNPPSITLSTDPSRPTVIGRSSTLGPSVVSSRINSVAISRRHAQIVLDPSTRRWSIVDLNSVNGLFVNGSKIKSKLLTEGDLVELGSSVNLVQKWDVSYVFHADPPVSLKRKRVEEIDPSGKVSEEATMAQKLQQLQEALDAAEKAKEVLALQAKVSQEKGREDAEKYKNELNKVLEETKKEAEEAKKLADEAEKKRLAAEKRSNELKEEKEAFEKKFHDGATALRERETEKAAMESRIEQLKKEMSLSTNKEEIEKQKQTLEKQTEELEVKMGEANALKNNLESMREEFVCPICQELMVFAHSLSCSHMFCRVCIEDWFKTKPKTKRTCPQCRVIHRGKTKPSRTTDNIIEKLAGNLSEDDREFYMNRRYPDRKKPSPSSASAAPAAAAAPAGELLVDQLRKFSNQAIEKNLKFLVIHEKWNHAHKQAFLKGLHPYKADKAARELYCKIIGLDHSFINASNRIRLVSACKNLGYTGAQQIAPMQQFLRMYILDVSGNLTRKAQTIVL